MVGRVSPSAPWVVEQLILDTADRFHLFRAKPEERAGVRRRFKREL
jgi:hypothetical protein